MKKKESIAAVLAVSLLVMLFVCHINLSENLKLNFELIQSLATTPKPGMLQIETWINLISCTLHFFVLFSLFPGCKLVWLSMC